MTTDNRTNELGKIRQNDAKHFAWSETQVEAAAKAIHALNEADPFDDYHPNHQRELRDFARAALVAAAGASPLTSANHLVDSDGCEAGTGVVGAAPQAESEPMYSLASRQWSVSCPCVLAEQVDPECEWHGRPEFRIGGEFHHDAPGVEIVTKAARVLHVATCCKLSADSEHQEPQNEDMFTAGVVLNSVPLAAPVLPSSTVDEIAEVIERARWRAIGGGTNPTVEAATSEHIARAVVEANGGEGR